MQDNVLALRERQGRGWEGESQIPHDSVYFVSNEYLILYLMSAIDNETDIISSWPLLRK